MVTISAPSTGSKVTKMYSSSLALRSSNSPVIPNCAPLFIFMARPRPCCNDSNVPANSLLAGVIFDPSSVD
ncbi:hypothetical protein Tco_1428779 [Tanacetum coccineum]